MQPLAFSGNDLPLLFVSASWAYGSSIFVFCEHMLEPNKAHGRIYGEMLPVLMASSSTLGPSSVYRTSFYMRR